MCLARPQKSSTVLTLWTSCKQYNNQIWFKGNCCKQHVVSTWQMIFQWQVSVLCGWYLIYKCIKQLEQLVTPRTSATCYRVCYRVLKNVNITSALMVRLLGAWSALPWRVLSSTICWFAFRTCKARKLIVCFQTCTATSTSSVMQACLQRADLRCMRLMPAGWESGLIVSIVTISMQYWKAYTWFAKVNKPVSLLW